MKNKIFQILLLLYCCTLAPSCNHLQYKEGLQEGDLLFQNLDCGELCDAIEAVTEGVDDKNFSHCAIVVKIKDTLKVIEAIGEEIQVNSLKYFFTRSGDTSKIENITIGRLKQQYENLILKATSNAKQMIGQPYDDEFALNNMKWYCSELIYEVFKEANANIDFFVLEPMTFIDPKTKAFLPAWKTYFETLGKEIPEGQAGINPGLISRSNKIEIIQIDRYK
ncbi:MAG: YiiX/YebB-like N1pC/P60 family cysteine hydrolase [bacterium]|nr:YiiX/YebB-like N1pC/P60 family cysteine hydrolase [bacterium]